MTKEEMIKVLKEAKDGVVDYRDGEKIKRVIDALEESWISEERTDGYPEEIDVPVLIEYSGRTMNITYDHALTIARWLDDDCGSEWFFDDLDVTEDGIEDPKVHRWWRLPEETDKTFSPAKLVKEFEKELENAMSEGIAFVTEFYDDHEKLCKELHDTYIQKNRAYGNSFSETYQKLGIISAVTRISDKYNRMCNLAVNKDIPAGDEALRDTLMDMANYCIMTVMELETNEN